MRFGGERRAKKVIGTSPYGAILMTAPFQITQKVIKFAAGSSFPMPRHLRQVAGGSFPMPRLPSQARRPPLSFFRDCLP
jgi:hypothetical protein